MGKNDLKRAASKHSQNLADMLKRQKLSISGISTISTTSENLAITNPVTSDVTSSMPAVVSPVLSEIENVENSITPADVSNFQLPKVQQLRRLWIRENNPLMMHCLQRLMNSFSQEIRSSTFR